MDVPVYHLGVDVPAQPLQYIYITVHCDLDVLPQKAIVAHDTYCSDIITLAGLNWFHTHGCHGGCHGGGRGCHGGGRGRHGCRNCDRHDGGCHDGSDFTLSLVELAVVVWWSLGILLTHQPTHQPTPICLPQSISSVHLESNCGGSEPIFDNVLSISMEQIT